MNIIGQRKYFYIISGLLIIASVVMLLLGGLKLGVDFTGGSLLEVTFINQPRPSQEEVKNIVAASNVELTTIQAAGDDGFILRFKEVDEASHQAVWQILQEKYSAAKKVDITPQTVDAQNSGIVVTGTTAAQENVPDIRQERFDAVGPTVGAELRQKATWALVLVVVAIIAYIAWAFRKVGKPVPSWKYGVIAVLALFHDVIISVGFFMVFCYFFGFEANTPFIAALLTIFGYSVNDTIIIFDRVRENLHRYQGDFEATVNQSLNETIARSINTTMTTLLSLIAILIFGGSSVREFVALLIVGIALGAYSSIFIASPLLVTWRAWSQKRSS